MIDMLVRLYELPKVDAECEALLGDGVTIRRVRSFEGHNLEHFIAANFSPKWVSEARVAMARQPAACFIATKDGVVIGFACYDVTSRGFLGPMGVGEAARGLGLGKLLLVRALEALHEMGHAYAIIGGVGPREFYEKTVGAIEIPGSTPGIYSDILPDPK